MKAFMFGFYIALFIIAPLIHKFIEQANEKATWSDLVVVIGLFVSGWTLAVFFVYYGWI